MELQAKGLGNREGDAISRSLEESKSQHQDGLEAANPALAIIRSKLHLMPHRLISQIKGVASTISYSCSNMQP